MAQLGELAARIAQVSDIYAATYNIDRTGDWHLLKLQEEMGELTQAYLTVSGRTRRPSGSVAREDMAREMADVLGMLLLLARDEGIDLDTAVQDKWLSWLDRDAVA
jgi:NTP pyrophosphatase (non-canonical NTP hydrolase)